MTGATYTTDSKEDGHLEIGKIGVEADVMVEEC